MDEEITSQSITTSRYRKIIMKKIGILGGGITGLSAARFLQKNSEVEVLEKKSVCGGIARTKAMNGIAYHVVGGHCFNSKHKEILDFVFNEVLPIDQWNFIKRISKIRLLGHEVMYPIEFSMKEIYSFNPEMALKMTADFLNSHDDGNYKNLDDWFRKKFGNALAENYFLPYNEKIWKNEPKKMNPEWVKDKLPIPDKMSFFESILFPTADNMPHAQFYYPKSNNQNTFIDALAKGVNIKYNFNTNSVKFDKVRKKWIVNNAMEYDILINTTPIDRFPELIENCPDEVIDAARLLKYNHISNVLWRTQPTNKTWTYLPEDEMIYHRYIHIGSFHIPTTPYSMAESIGSNSFDELVNNGKKDPFLIEALDYNQSDHAYVVFDENYIKSTTIIKEYFKSIGLYSIGRFGDWQYYNMDICMKQSLELSRKLMSQQ